MIEIDCFHLFTCSPYSSSAIFRFFGWGVGFGLSYSFEPSSLTTVYFKLSVLTFLILGSKFSPLSS